MTDEVRPRRSERDLLAFNGWGRPWTISSTSAVRYVALLAAGGFHEPSARACGLDPRSVARWRARGMRLVTRAALPAWAGAALRSRPALDSFCRVLACIADPLQDPALWLVGFALACVEAEGGSEASAVLIWRRAMAERPDMAPRFLERRYPDRWGAPKPGLAAKVEAQGAAGSVSLTIYAPPEQEP